jgi:multidrug efflux pump subunit AcrB
MPTLLFTTAFSMFISAITRNGVIPVMLQIFLFFFSANKLIGNYQIWMPILRFNEIGKYEFYREKLPDNIINRVFITMISVLLVLGTVFVYSKLRKGENAGRIKMRLRWGKKDDYLSEI